MCRKSVQTVVLSMIIAMTLFSLSALSEDRYLGTCYTVGWNPHPTCDSAFAALAGIESFRLELSWAQLEGYQDSFEFSLPQLADTILSAYPPDALKIFMFKFHHPEKMDVPQGGENSEVYKYHTSYKKDFFSWCRFVGEYLGDVDRGINHIVLHNEPDYDWSYLSPPGYGSPKWRNSPQDYVDQCEECIDTIKAYNQDAYIIFGSFAGPDTSGVVRDFVERMDTSKIDCIDFHCYGESMSASTAAMIGAGLDTFCTVNRGKDWSMLETAGPNLSFPIEEEINDTTIWTYLLNYVEFIRSGTWNPEIHDSIFIDSLYTLTEIVDSCCLLLPENWFENNDCDNLEDYKVEEFQHRVTEFHSKGARFVHWFSAWRYHPYNFPWQPDCGPCGPECGPPELSDSAFTAKLIKQAQRFPVHILDPENPEELTDLARWMGSYEPPGMERQYGGELTVVLETMQLSNYPNVFNSRTRIDYKLSKDGHVKLEIFDIMGKRVDILIDRYKKAGEHSVIWNAEDYSSGVYFCILTQGLLQTTQKMVLVK